MDLFQLTFKCILQVAKSIKTVLRASQAVISIKLDSKRIEALQLDISSYTVAEAIVRTPKIKLKHLVYPSYCCNFLHVCSSYLVFLYLVLRRLEIQVS